MYYKVFPLKFKVFDNVNDLRANALLRLSSLCADVRRAGNGREINQLLILGGLLRKHVETRTAQLAGLKRRKQGSTAPSFILAMVPSLIRGLPSMLGV